MSANSLSFAENFALLTGHKPMQWQYRLFNRIVKGDIPAALDLPTGLGKTSVMAIWLIARALANEETLKSIPRRLIYVVDRRAVVDQATEEAEKLRDALNCDDKPESRADHLKGLPPDKKEHAFSALRALKKSLGIGDTKSLPISTLRGAQVDNREWLNDPASPAIIVGTIDMIGSRLLFEGYGVSRKMRPYHAGLLGADALAVLDESHLVPPFESLLRAIEGDEALWPKDRAQLPRFIVLPLSATQRAHAAEESRRKPFVLEPEDWRDETASRRLNACKKLHVESLNEKDHEKQLAEVAFALATKERPARVVVFCNRRERKDDGAGPSAQGVAEAISAKAKQDKVEIQPPELLVGARRVYEREQVANKLKALGFAGHADSPERPAFLVATSAGEVGIDFDADHMVCDLVPWERMVQRLGRVNRRGGEHREAQVVVFDSSGIEKDEKRKALLIATRALLKRIETDLDGEAGPAMLLELRSKAQEEMEKASTPEPLRPALTRALVDAWSMTALEDHTGRPEIAPWLRGWVDEKAQTAVIWRKFLPLGVDDSGRPIFTTKRETSAFFDAAPPQDSEKLETETFRVADWLQNRAHLLLQRRPPEESIESGNLEQSSVNEAAEPATVSQSTRPWRREDIVAMVLSPSGDYERYLNLASLAQDRKGKDKEEFHGVLAGCSLVVDAGFGGLSQDGLLKETGEHQPETADALDDWSRKAGFRVRRAKSNDRDNTEDDWRFEDDFVLRRNGDGDPEEYLVVEHYKSAAQSEDARSISRPQTLADHQACAGEKASRIAAKVRLSDDGAETLTVAAILHDEGKKAPRWQRAFKAPREKDAAGAYKVFAKTRGPIDQELLDGYRHEFGSLPEAEKDGRFQNLPEDWRDLVLHLIAAHHGQARPVIGRDGCEDAPPSALEARARDVALRFARLQRRWGPWGLAWWEALLRAADQQASRDNDMRPSRHTPDTEES